MAHTVTIQTSDPATIQDVENYVTSLYQRGLDVSHITEMEDVPPSAPIDEESHEVIGSGKSKDFPKSKVESSGT